MLVWLPLVLQQQVCAQLEWWSEGKKDAKQLSLPGEQSGHYVLALLQE